MAVRYRTRTGQSPETRKGTRITINRRIARARTALYDALVALIRERDYDAIRVEDILDRANVGRSTFYTHFKSKDELLARSLDRLRSELVMAIDALPAPDIGIVSQTLFRHIDGHRDIQASLAGGAANAIVRQAIAANLAQVVRPLLPQRTGSTAIRRRRGRKRKACSSSWSATNGLNAHWPKEIRRAAATRGHVSPRGLEWAHFSAAEIAALRNANAI